jgi:hypothetical protein
LSTTLQVPYAAPTLSITLPNPELDDVRSVDNQSRVKFGMDGSLHAFKKGNIEKLQYTFANMTKVKAQELEDFIITAAAQDIKITDYDGHIWQSEVHHTRTKLHFNWPWQH